MLGTISYSFFLEIAFKGTALLSAAWVAVRLLRGRSAALRHLVWNVVFTSVLVLPFLSIALPALRVPFTRSTLSTDSIFQADVQGSGHETAGKAPSPALTAPELKSKTSVHWGMVLTVIWAIGAAVSLGQMLIGLVAMERLRGRAKPFQMPGFASLMKLLEIEQQVNLLETKEGSMPITYGLFRPTVFMPADAMKWNVERLRIVLLHELAHVRRRDGATHLVARSTLGLYWWNPLIWVAWHEFLKERERATDDLVLKLGARASDYASHLLEIANSMQSPAKFGWAAVPLARHSQLEGRVLAILDPVRDRKAPQQGATIAACLSTLLIMAPVAAMKAKGEAPQATVVNQASISPAGAFLIKEGDEAREQGKWEQAKALYTKALTVLDKGPEAATVLIHLGTAEIAAKDFGQATTDFERAQAADSSKTGEATMWMAIAQQRQNNLEAGDGFYQNALAAEDPNSVSAAIIMRLHAALLQQQGRQEEANKMENEADRILKAQVAQATAASQAASFDVYRVSGDVTAPTLVSKVDPEYTADARIAKYQGTTLLSVEIGIDGVASNIKVVRPLGLGLDQKAMEAVSQWRFKPGTKDGQPVRVSANIEVNFRLL